MEILGQFSAEIDKLDALMSWGVDEHLLFASLAHHGRPFAPTSRAGEEWEAVAGYDAVAASDEIGAMIRGWFPFAFASDVNRRAILTPDRHPKLTPLSRCWVGSARPGEAGRGCAAGASAAA
jgi:hypothetical protein